LNPGPPAPQAGDLRPPIERGQGVTPDSHLKYSWTSVINGTQVSRIIVEGRRLLLEFPDQDKLTKFVELLRLLGVTTIIEKREIRIRYEDGFRLYLEKDRQLDGRTIRDYLNYLRKLDGKVVDYTLYLEISHNKWMVKCVRLYLDYLHKRGEISFEDYQRLKSIFKVRKKVTVNSYRINEEDLIITLYHEDLKEPEILVLRLLLYSGVRFSEAIKLINEFDESKLECFDSFCRCGLFWLRGRKRCDWVYIPKKLLDKLRRFRGYYASKKVHSLARHFEKKYNVDLKLFRKFFYRVCRDTTGKEVCDFLQSRISELSIGDVHYDDLLSRADRDYPIIVKRIDDLIKEVLLLMSEGVPAEGVEVAVGENELVEEKDVWESYK